MVMLLAKHSAPQPTLPPTANPGVHSKARRAMDYTETVKIEAFPPVAIRNMLSLPSTLTMLTLHQQ